MKRHPKVPGCKRLRGRKRNMFRQGLFTVVGVRTSRGQKWMLFYNGRIQSIEGTIDELRFSPWTSFNL